MMTEQEIKSLFQQANDLYQQGKLDEAADIWRKIKREDSSKQYARAQFNLGFTLKKQGDTEEAIAAYRNIKHEDSPEQYAKAQANISSTLEELGRMKEAVATYRNILRQDLQNVDGYKELYYRLESRIIIAECILDEDVKIKMAKILNYVENIIQKLLIDKEKCPSESKVAHYTRPSTAQAVINTDSPSPFRFSTIKGVNDPTEGLALYRYIGKYCNLPSALTIEPADVSLAVFISCFTFNHDSLNQFRLYGKEDGREASGVSLVFKDSFFSSENPFGMLSTHSNALIQNLSNENPTIKSDPQTESAHTETHFLPKLPLFRCIYLDPQSGYLALAHRDKATFYAESWHGNKTADHKTVCTTANEEWEVYQDKISTLTEEVKTALSELVEMIKDAAEGAENDVLEALAFILQPLRYLVKHAAFQEEQECRMFYICDLINDNRIRADWNNRQMYIEYEPLVRDSLDKIYLSPGAEPYADFFKRRLPDLARSGKIRRSQNPFRNK